MKKYILPIIAAIFMFISPSCENMKDGWLKIPGVQAPINFGVKYQLEKDLYIIVVTGDKGGFEVKLEGSNESIKVVEGGYEVKSSASGLTYQITTDDKGRVSVFVVGGDGKIQPYTPTRVQ
jgi:hypothetical protein